MKTNKEVKLVRCGCGCGMWIKKVDKNGIRRKFAKGHSTNKGFKHTKEVKEKMRTARMKNGYSALRNNQKKQVKQLLCIFKCKHSLTYVLHYEPIMNKENYLTWEGRLVNLCTSCQRRVGIHHIKLSKNIGVAWNIEDTKKAIGEEFYMKMIKKQKDEKIRKRKAYEKWAKTY